MIPNRPLNAPVSADVAGLAAPLLHCSSPSGGSHPRVCAHRLDRNDTVPGLVPETRGPGYETAHPDGSKADSQSLHRTRRA